MRKVMGTAGVVKTGIIAAGLGLILSMPAVAAPDEQTPDAKAYLSFSFGGDKSGARALHYGLRLDHDRSFVQTDQPLPALMKIDFSRSGLNAMQVNGLNVLRPAYRLGQSEVEEEVVEEDEGFFEGIGNWFSGVFGNLFGDDDSESSDVAADASDAEAADEEPVADGDGTFLSYDAVDWGLLAVGVAGIGFVASEVFDGDDDSDPTASTGGGGGGGGLPPCGLPPNGPFPPNCELPLPFAGRQGGLSSESRDHQQWLDSGTGQMGDLSERN